MRRTLKWLAALFAAAFTGCSSLPFHPDKNVTFTPDAVGLAYTDVTLTTDDGVHIAAWYLPAQRAAQRAAQSAGQEAGQKTRQETGQRMRQEAGQGAGRQGSEPHGAKQGEAKQEAGQGETGAATPPGHGKTLLFFHGNAGNLSHRLESLALFNRLGLSVFIIDYRGFGNSDGKPSVDGTVRDAGAAWDWLARQGTAPENIVIFGRSLGGGVAAALAAERQAGGLILESTFTCLEDVAAGMFPWLPVGLFIPQDYDTAARLASVRCPVLFVHSPDDEVVPYRLGRALYEGHGGPKSWLAISGPHNYGYLLSGAVYTDGLAAYLSGI